MREGEAHGVCPLPPGPEADPHRQAVGSFLREGEVRYAASPGDVTEVLLLGPSFPPAPGCSPFTCVPISGLRQAFRGVLLLSSLYR